MNQTDRSSRRRVLAGMAVAPPALLLARACGAAAPVAEAVSLPDFRKPEDPDDTAALARAFASGRPVHAPGGRGSGPGGRYLVGNNGDAQLPSGATLFGDGPDRTVFARSYRGPAAFILHCDSGSPDRRRNITGLRFRDLTFEDEVARRGFEEYSYLVMLNGVTDALFERVRFRGFRGDGLHLGSSTTSRTERHNLDVIVRDCEFDGVSANNRNAISIIDGERIIIEGCRFLNVTRPGDGSAAVGDPMNPRTGLGQPGAIDLEPNGDSFAIIRDVTIRRNRFSGGGGAAVSLLLTSNTVTRVPQSGIVIEDNEVADRFGAFYAFGFAGDEALRSDRGYGITLRNNRVRGCTRPLIVAGIRGIDVVANRFADCTEPLQLGYERTCADLSLERNVIERVGGEVVPYGLWVRSSVDLAIRNNQFVDCGPPNGDSGIAIGFVAGEVRRVTLEANSFTAPAGRMQQAVSVFRDVRLDRATLRVGRNEERLRGRSLREALLG